MMYLHLLSLGTLVPEAPCFVFDVTRRRIYCKFDDMAFASTLIWYHTHKKYTHNLHRDQ